MAWGQWHLKDWNHWNRQWLILEIGFNVGYFITYRINKLSIESIAKFLDAWRDFVEHNTLLATIWQEKHQMNKNMSYNNLSQAEYLMFNKDGYEQSIKTYSGYEQSIKTLKVHTNIILIIFREAPIDRHRSIFCMTGPDRWPAGQSHVLPIPSQSFYCQRHRQRRHSAHSVVCKHIVSRENGSNFNGIKCKQQLIMYLCRARWGLHSLCERNSTQSKIT